MYSENAQEGNILIISFQGDTYSFQWCGVIWGEILPQGGVFQHSGQVLILVDPIRVDHQRSLKQAQQSPNTLSKQIQLLLLYLFC